MKVIGHATPRIDAAVRVSGRATYTRDVYLDGMLYAQMLRSPYPHARIKAIDLSKARALPGVKAIVTHENCQYVWGAHVPIAREAGITDQEVESIAGAPDAATWSPLDAALLRVPDQLKKSSSLDDVTWESLRQVYSDAQLLDALMVVGHYFMVGQAMNTIRVDPEPGHPRLGQTR
jgi:CO/xanthine dehydrogenase Mo-binding subunit